MDGHTVHEWRSENRLLSKVSRPEIAGPLWGSDHRFNTADRRPGFLSGHSGGTIRRYLSVPQALVPRVWAANAPCLIPGRSRIPGTGSRFPLATFRWVWAGPVRSLTRSL